MQDAARTLQDGMVSWSARFASADLKREIAHDMFEKEPLYRLLAEAILSLPGSRRRVLEVGCGSAIDSYAVASRTGAEHHALDLSEEAIAVAHEIASCFPRRISLHRGNLFALPFPAGSFDLVMSQGVMEHFPDPRPAMREQLRVLSSGGILAVDVPQRYSLYTVFKRRAQRRGEWPWGWEREYTLGELRRLGAEMGLDVVRAGAWGYDRILGCLRWPYEKMSRRVPMPDLADRWHGRLLAPLREAAWSFVEERWGARFQQCVTVLYRRQADREGR